MEIKAELTKYITDVKQIITTARAKTYTAINTATVIVFCTQCVLDISWSYMKYKTPVINYIW